MLGRLETKTKMMRKTLLGRTGLPVSEIAFGAGTTGGILIKGDETEAIRALNRALATGINWIDTAALYGNGASEATIGRHIACARPATLYLDQGPHRTRRDG